MNADQFFERLQSTPSDAAAVQGAASTLTYRDLLEQVEARAAQLAREGVRVLGSILDNGPDWIVTDLAALRAGVVHVPIPGFFTAQQQSHVMAAARIDATLSPGSDGAARLQRHAAPRAVLPEGTAKITFTSGTTGFPKGVCLSAEAQLTVASAIADATAGLGIVRHLCALPLPVLLENIAGVLAPLMRGATIVAPPLEDVGLRGSSRFAAASLHASVEASGCQSIVLLPQMLRAWTAWLQARGRRAPPSLRLVAVGGAMVGAATIEAARAAGLPAYEGYGLSEGASVQTLNLPGADQPGSVGRLLPHSQMRISRDGEIEISGTLFLGYLGGDDPSRAQRERWWPTGDIGRVDADGFVHIQGRKDAVLITGYGRNVSPEWVEALLESNRAVGRAVVLGAGLPCLGAVLWPSSAGEVSDADLAAAVSGINQQLPDYARIGHWARARHEFSEAGGLATANGRPRRDPIAALYAAEVFNLTEQ